MATCGVGASGFGRASIGSERTRGTIPPCSAGGSPFGAGALPVDTAASQRAQVLDRLASVVDEGRGASRSVTEPPPLTAEGVVGGALAVVYARLLRADRRPLVDLLNPLMGMIVLPYLGTAAALRGSPRTRGARAVARGKGEIVRDPLEGMNIRLTYRTVRS
jgi:hypothetical protein